MSCFSRKCLISSPSRQAFNPLGFTLFDLLNVELFLVNKSGKGAPIEYCIIGVTQPPWTPQYLPKTPKNPKTLSLAWLPFQFPHNSIELSKRPNQLVSTYPKLPTNPMLKSFVDKRIALALSQSAAFMLPLFGTSLCKEVMYN